MKNIIILFLMILSPFIAFAQQETEAFRGYEYKNSLKLSPFEMASSEFQMSYERYFKDRTQSFVVFPTIILYERNNESKEGFQLEAQYRFYLTHLQKESSMTLYMYNIGFYAAPYISGINQHQIYNYGYYNDRDFNYVEIRVDEKVSAIEGGAVMGIQFDITKRVLLDFYAGGGIRKANVESNYPNLISYGIFEKGYTGVKPTVGLQFGIIF